MKAVNIVLIVFLAFISYGLIKAGVEWYYTLPASLLVFCFMSAIMQFTFNVFGAVFKKQND